MKYGTAILRQVADPLIPWQWHGLEPWIDAITYEGRTTYHGMTTYLASFMTRENAIAYGLIKGWTADP